MDELKLCPFCGNETWGVFGPSARVSASTVSDGYVMVPVEPTKRMIEDAYAVWQSSRSDFAAVYKAMLLAARSAGEGK
jgi:hypothetical protein